MKNKLISVGKILNFHGIKGEVKMGFTAGNEALIKKLSSVFIFIDNQKKSFQVESVRFHKNFAIIKFSEINSIDEVMTVKGLFVYLEEARVKSELEKDEFLINDLIGLIVKDTKGNNVGIVNQVGENRATSLISVKKPDGKIFLVPFVKELVPEVDTENGYVTVNMIDGLDD